MKKIILILLLALVCTMQGIWAQSQTSLILVANENELKSNITDGATLILQNNIDIGSEVVIDGNKSVVIELNGYTINRGLSSAANYGHVFKILSGSTLTISDNNLSGNNSGAIVGGFTDRGGAINNTGTFILEGGVIRNNNSTKEGAGIFNHDGGTVIINGGLIFFNVTKWGGGISNEATLIINGGTIQANQARGGTGGGIWNSGTLTINGGNIKQNIATEGIGGGIWNEGTLTVNGGTIQGNEARGGAGGGIWNRGTLTINDGTIVENKGVYGGGVCCSSGTGTAYGVATIKGGTITQNSSFGENNRNLVGNGVFYESGTLNMEGNPVICDNLNGDNLFMSEDKKITVTGAFTSGANIGYTWTSESNTFTSGFAEKNPGTDPNTVFTSDRGEEIFLKNNEAYQVSSMGFVTDLMIISRDGDYSNIETLQKKYKNLGWSLIGVDLNRDVGGKFIYLLYKKGNSNPITDIYLKCGSSSSAPETLTSNGRIYNRVYADGASDLNSGAGGDYIFLYYTKEILSSSNRAITGLTVNNSETGAVGKNGGSTPCCLNEGTAVNGYAFIYLHTTTTWWTGFETTTAQYVDLDGTTKTVTANIIDNYNALLPSGWYVVSENVSIPDRRLKVQGSVNIILSDGKTLTNSKGTNVYEGHTLTVWGQSSGTGKWIAGIAEDDDDELYAAAIGGNGSNGNSGRITINGGTISATGQHYGAGIGGGKTAITYTGQITEGDGEVYINGGTVTAQGGYYAAGIGGGEDGKGFVTINGGTVTTTGGHLAPGIGGGKIGNNCTICITGGNIKAMRGTGNGMGNSGGAAISLDYTEDVSINSANYLGTVTLQKDFMDTDGNYYPRGVVADVRVLAGKTLVPAAMVALANDADNSTVLSTYDGKKHLVTLAGRTLYTNGDWNTLCLPFSLADLSGTPLAGATVKTLSSSEFSNSTLTLTFSDNLTSIEAGKPYIVRWGDNIVKIGTKAEWDDFAAKVNNGTYTNSNVLLTADITEAVTTSVGTNEHPFTGIFNGQGHTLNVNITDTENQGTAPFRYIYGATIQNVKTTGTINGTMHCAGLVGIAKTATDYSTNGTLMANSIRNCEVATTISCGGTTHTHCGGILGHGTRTATTITDCLFSGSIGGATEHVGIIYGWGDNGGVHAIVNCMANGSSYGNPTKLWLLDRNGGDQIITNCYRNTQAFDEGTYTTATGSNLVAQLGSAWEVRGGKAVPKVASFNVVNPVFKDVTIYTDIPTAITPAGGYVTFMGTYSPVVYEAGTAHKDILFLGGGSTLYYPDGTNSTTIGACRAYFQLNGITAGEPTLSRIVLNFGGDEPSGIENVPYSMLNVPSEGWFTLDGCRLSGKPTQSGLYISNGKKVVIK